MPTMGFGVDAPEDQSQPQQQPPQSLFEMLQGAGGNAASLIAPPPQGWQSNAAAFGGEGGVGPGWISGNNAMNPNALAFTKAGPQMPHGIDPFSDIVYNYMGNVGQEGGGSGFTLGTMGPDLFGGRQFKGGGSSIKDIPRELQPWLAPSLMRYFYNQGYTSQGGHGAPWTQAFAPTGPEFGKYPYDNAWPGIAKYDPWHRTLGEGVMYS